MDFLKDILGEELYETALKKINEHNSNEENKDNQIKLGNLAKGEYVAKGKYTTEIDKLNGIITNKDSELGEANKLIDTLKKATKDNEGLQGEIAKYQNEVATLQTQLNDIKLNTAIKVALMSDKAIDVDYLTYKLKESGEPIKLDENDNIENWKDKVTALKTAYPNMFETVTPDGLKVLGNNKLPNEVSNKSLTRQELLNKPYAERMKIFNDTPDLYNLAMNNK